MLVAAVVCLDVFALVAMIDGVYFHLVKYRLFLRPESRYEHQLHTVHAALFPVLILLLFLRSASGLFLWATLGLIVADFIVEMMDVVCERASRAQIGGLSTPEYAVHVLAITARVSAFTLAVASRPSDSWRAIGTSLGPTLLSPPLAVLCWILLGGGVAMAAVHVRLSWRTPGMLAELPPSAAK